MAQPRCSRCDHALIPDDRFCPSCGRARNEKRPHGAARGRPGAYAVFALALVAGGAALVHVYRETPPAARAVPGTPSSATDAAQLPPDHPPIELPEEITAFLDELARQAERAPNDAEAWRKLARARYRASLIAPRYYEDALAAIDRLLAMNPEDTEAIRMAANLAYDRGDFARAEQLFRRYLEVDPRDPGVRTDLASAILFQGRKDEAERLYRAVLADHPDFVQAHVNLGIALHSEGKRDEAMDSFERARELAKDPDQRARIERIIAEASGAAPPTPEQSATTPSSSTNAESAFQRAADAVLRAHTILGPKIEAVEWTGEASARVRLRAFPMDKMPAVVRNKFKAGMNAKLEALRTEHGVADPLAIELVDAETGKTMDRLDGKEWVAEFSEEAEQQR